MTNALAVGGSGGGSSSIIMLHKALLTLFLLPPSTSTGRLYVTFDALYFHSQILSFTTQKIIPFTTIITFETSTIPLGGTYLTVVLDSSAAGML